MINNINERVKVGAVFGDNFDIKPVWFIWQNQKYSINSITYRWSSRKGREALQHFSVTDGVNLYELCYNTGSSIWTLAKVEAGDG